MISPATPVKAAYVAVEPPSPDEIKRRAARIREGWSEHVRRERCGYPTDRVEIMSVPQGIFGPSF